MIDVAIDNLALGGRGVGRHDGMAVFVPYTMPGDRVLCRPVREKKRYCEAELVEIVEPSTDRIAPVCPVFTECGGCQWQHLSYNAQLEWKEKLFRETLTRAVPVDDKLFRPITASPQRLGYRCRAQIKCRQADNGFVAGFYRAGSHYVVDIDTCPLLAPSLNSLFQTIKPMLAGFAFAHRVPQIDLSVDDHGQSLLIVHYLERDHAPLAELLVPVAVELQCSFFVQKGRKENLVALYQATAQAICPSPEIQLRFPPGGFVQVNLEQNRNLVAAVLNHVPAGSRVLDLYCGVGNFSLPVARRAASVVGIEDYKPAIAMASDNANRLGLDNARFVSEDAASGLAREWSDGFDVVILDPPRAGAYDVARQLVELQPPAIIYVSCDPMTLGRDLQKLLNNGYRPVLLRACDMFPQTAHIEGMVVLERVC